jgi:hypothetical protein
MAVAVGETGFWCESRVFEVASFSMFGSGRCKTASSVTDGMADVEGLTFPVVDDLK